MSRRKQITKTVKPDMATKRNTSEDVFSTNDEWKKKFLPQAYEEESILRLSQSDETDVEKGLRLALRDRVF